MLISNVFSSHEANNNFLENQQQIDDLLSKIKTAFDNACDKKERRIALGLIAKKISYPKAVEVIPALTYHEFHQSKILFARMLAGQNLQKRRQTRISFHKPTVNRFVEFITR